MGTTALPSAWAAEAPQFNLGDALSSNLVALAFGVVLAVLIPWLTTMFTKGHERRVSERGERVEAAQELFKAAAKMHADFNAPPRPGETHRASDPTEVTVALNRILLLTSSGHIRGLTELHVMYTDRNSSSTAAVTLSPWIARGRFPLIKPFIREPATRLRPESRTTSQP